MPLDIMLYVRTSPVLLLQLCTCNSVCLLLLGSVTYFFRTYNVYVYVDFVKIIGRT